MKKIFDKEKYHDYYKMIESLISEDFKTKKKIVISDCDGILTNGTSLCDNYGKFAKIYGSHDKEMIYFLKKIGFDVVFISADKEGEKITLERIKHLHCNFIVKKVDERTDFIDFYKKNGYYVVYMGDSISDIPSLSKADYSGCPQNSFGCVKEYCDYVSSYDGGQGAFADIMLNLIINNLDTD